MGNLCMKRSIWLLDEYIWVIHDEHFNELKNTPPNHRFESEEENHYKGKGRRSPSVSFVFVIIRSTGGLDKTAFGIKIRKCSTGKVHGTMSVFVDMDTGETWNNNRFGFNSLTDGAYTGLHAYHDNLLDTAQSL